MHCIARTLTCSENSLWRQMKLIALSAATLSPLVKFSSESCNEVTEYCLTAAFCRWNNSWSGFFFSLPQHTNLCSYTTIKQSLKFNQKKHFKQWQADKLFRKGLNKTWKEIHSSCAAWELAETKKFQAHSFLKAFSPKLFVFSKTPDVCLNNILQLQAGKDCAGSDVTGLSTQPFLVMHPHSST